jgi:hypothetical protein
MIWTALVAFWSTEHIYVDLLVLNYCVAKVGALHAHMLNNVHRQTMHMHTGNKRPQIGDLQTVAERHFCGMAAGSIESPV